MAREIDSERLDAPRGSLCAGHQDRPQKYPDAGFPRRQIRAEPGPRLSLRHRCPGVAAAATLARSDGGLRSGYRGSPLGGLDSALWEAAGAKPGGSLRDASDRASATDRPRAAVSRPAQIRSVLCACHGNGGEQGTRFRRQGHRAPPQLQGQPMVGRSCPGLPYSPVGGMRSDDPRVAIRLAITLAPISTATMASEAATGT